MVTTNNQQGTNMEQHQHQNQHQQQEKKSWENAITLKSEDGSVEVRVNVLRLRRPLYSIQIGGAEGSRFLRIQVGGQGKIVVQAVDTTTLAQLVTDAIDWVQKDAQSIEDEHIASRLERETKAANYGKPQHKTTGKTEKAREKRRGKENR
jgi:hypothetical protein